MISVGTDPEFVIIDKDNKPVAAPSVFKYKKHKPFKSPFGNIFCDNANIELNPKPAITREEFIENIKNILKETYHNLNDGFNLLALAGVNYSDKDLSNKYCQQFGCEPDYDAWQMIVNTPPTIVDKTFRSCGGHIHVGSSDTKNDIHVFENKIKIIKGMDNVLGVSAVLLDNEKGSIARKNLYGKAGCHRVKSYGVEYRTLSNFWLRSPELAGWAFDMTRIVATKYEALYRNIFEPYKIINENNIKDAEKELSYTYKNFPTIKKLNEAALMQKPNELLNVPLSKTWGI